MLIQIESYDGEDNASSILMYLRNVRFGKWALRCSILLLFGSAIERSLNQENFNADVIEDNMASISSRIDELLQIPLHYKYSKLDKV